MIKAGKPSFLRPRTLLGVLFLTTSSLVLAACSQLLPSQYSSSTPSPSPRIKSAIATRPLTSTLTSTVTPPPSVTPSPIKTLLPTATPTPAWTVVHDFNRRQSGVAEITVSALSRSEHYTFKTSDCPIDIASFQLDLLISDAPGMRPFNAHLDLHGFGSVRSWYAQLGYTFNGSSLGFYCQAYSYSSDAPRFWKLIDATAHVDTWNTFTIEVIETGEGWGYAFSYLLNGEEVCFYQPPEAWDGNNSYDVLFQRVEIYRTTDNNTGTSPITVQFDNHIRYVSPTCRGVPSEFH